MRLCDGWGIKAVVLVCCVWLLPISLHTVVGAEAVATAPAAVAGAAQARGLTVVAGDGVKATDATTGLLDYGAVDALGTPALQHDFTLRNDGKTPVTIARLQPTCGCTSVLLGEGTETTKTLQPGDTVTVHVSVDIMRFRGLIHKAVRVYGNDGNQALAVMEIDANIKEPVAFSDSKVDFGKVASGTSRSVPLSVTVSPKLSAHGALPKLLATNPYVQITVAAGTAAPGAAPAAELHYLVTVSAKAPTGPLMGTITFAPTFITALANTNAVAHPAPMDETFANALQMAAVPMVGEVVGKITATPSEVVFGTVRGSRQQVTLSSSSAQLLSTLKVASSSPWIIPHIIPMGKPRTTPVAVDGAHHQTSSVVLELQLSPRTPAGSLNTQVLITTREGEILNLPVTAYVAPAPAPPGP